MSMFVSILLVLLLAASLIGLLLGLIKGKKRMALISGGVLLTLGIGCWIWLIWFFAH